MREIDPERFFGLKKNQREVVKAMKKSELIRTLDALCARLGHKIFLKILFDDYPVGTLRKIIKDINKEYTDDDIEYWTLRGEFD